MNATTRITAGSLLDRARHATGLVDFGDPWFLGPLEHLVTSLNKDACLTAADPAVIQPSVLQVQLFVAVLRPMQKHIAVLDDHIAEAFAVHPDAAIFRSLPGAGPALAPRLLVGFGADRSRYPLATSIQKFSGIAPVTVRSGKQLWIHWRWNAPVFLRQTFVEWAGQTVVHCPWAKAFYRQQRDAGKRHQAALRALAFKWIRIVWRCWQSRIPYNEATYIDALARRHSPIINTLSSS